MEGHSMMPDSAPSYDHEYAAHEQHIQFTESHSGNLELDAVPVLHVMAKDLMEPLIPLMPEASAPYVQAHALLILVTATTLLFLVSIAIIKVLLNSFKPKTVVLYGPMEAGKTTLLHTLEGVARPQGTVSSMKPTEAIVTLMGTNKKVKVVDVPGHPRLRSVYEQKAASASCIVFVVDSASFVAEKQIVAELLHQVLQQQSLSARRGCFVVLACNKADLEERAFSQDFIVRQLEKEIIIRTAALLHERAAHSAQRTAALRAPLLVSWQVPHLASWQAELPTWTDRCRGNASAARRAQLSEQSRAAAPAPVVMRGTAGHAGRPPCVCVHCDHQWSLHAPAPRLAVVFEWRSPQLPWFTHAAPQCVKPAGAVCNMQTSLAEHARAVRVASSRRCHSALGCDLWQAARNN